MSSFDNTIHQILVLGKVMQSMQKPVSFSRWGGMGKTIESG